MPNLNDEVQVKCRRVSEFYGGKSLFITGAAGYLGSILLEILLRCFPDIISVYILLRPKKGVDPKSRKSLMFEKWIFNKLLKENPKITDKVHVIPGDVSQPNLGMSDEDIAEVTKNASIVFHVAATISFFKKLRPTAIQNSLATKYVIELCKKIPKLDVLVYTSTAYSNSNRSPDIEENIYRLPFSAERFMDKLENGMEGDFEKMASICKPQWPNNYTFSKCLTENILGEMASDIPVAIVRPSIIAPTWKGSLPGYIEKGSGLIDFSLAVGKGFARVIRCDPNARFDLIPADIVANAHIVAAWSVGTERSPSPFVVNCTGGHAWKVTFGDYCGTQHEMVNKYMLPKTFQEPDMILVQNRFVYWANVIYEHYIPAIILDAVFYFRGIKLRIFPLYKFFERVMEQLCFFMSTTFDFAVDNFNILSEQLDQQDQEMFYMNLEEVSLKEMVHKLPTAAPFYDWKMDRKSQKMRRNTVVMRTMMITFLKRGSVVLICWLIYIIVFKIIL